MKFRIERASDWKGLKQPTPDAVEVRVKNWSDEDCSDWYVEIGTLEDLLALYVEVGAELIIDKEKGQPHIRIYDNYIE